MSTPVGGLGYLNARAAECVPTRAALGELVVRFQGNEYHPIGFFLARRAGGRELFYILCPTDRDLPQREDK